MWTTLLYLAFSKLHYKLFIILFSYNRSFHLKNSFRKMTYSSSQDVFDLLRDVTPLVQGVLTVEHAGKPAKKFDGICLTLLVTLNTKTPELLDGIDSHKYEWHPLPNEQLAARLQEKMEDGLCVPLLMLR